MMVTRASSAPSKSPHSPSSSSSYFSPTFQTSSLLPEEERAASNLVAEAASTIDPGCRLLQSVNFETDTTHLIVGRDVSKTEKILVGVARGVVVVRLDYIERSILAGEWLPPEAFDVGGDVGLGEQDIQCLDVWCIESLF